MSCLLMKHRPSNITIDITVLCCSWLMRESLARAGVGLDRHALSTLCLTEPRTFRAVVAVAAHKTCQPVEEGGLGIHSMGPGPDIDIVGKL